MPAWQLRGAMGDMGRKARKAPALVIDTQGVVGRARYVAFPGERAAVLELDLTSDGEIGVVVDYGDEVSRVGTLHAVRVPDGRLTVADGAIHISHKGGRNYSFFFDFEGEVASPMAIRLSDKDGTLLQETLSAVEIR